MTVPRTLLGTPDPDPDPTPTGPVWPAGTVSNLTANTAVTTPTVVHVFNSGRYAHTAPMPWRWDAPTTNTTTNIWPLNVVHYQIGG